MPWSQCAVGICKSKSLRRRENQINHLSFHSFPKDKKIRKIWITRCKRKDNFNQETWRICSKHFREEDFEDDMKSRLLGLPRRYILKKNSVPTLRLTPETVNLDQLNVSNRTKRMLDKQKKKEHDEIIRILLSSPNKDSPQNVQGEVSSENKPEAHDCDNSVSLLDIIPETICEAQLNESEENSLPTLVQMKEEMENTMENV